MFVCSLFALFACVFRLWSIVRCGMVCLLCLFVFVCVLNAVYGMMLYVVLSVCACCFACAVCD